MTRRGFIASGLALPPALHTAMAKTKIRPTTGRPQDHDAALRGFIEFYERRLRHHGIVGSSFMFLDRDRTAASHYFGEANPEKKQRVDENTIYHWASITKTFTGVAVMQLRDRGRLSLDDSIIKYLPELRAVHNPHGDMSAITLRHLMSHSAGFRDATWPWGGDKPWHPHEPARWEQIVAMLPYTEILFPPGSRYSYSNPGIIFLGRVIELLTNDDYETYIDKNIFRPLDMRRSYFDATPYHLLKHRSHSYYLRNGKLEQGRFDADTGITVSNGGLNAPLDDMSRYIRFLTGSGDPERYEGVLKRSSITEMQQPQIKLPQAKDGRARRDAMGLTFFIEDNYGQHFIGHSGTQNGFLSHFYLQPDTRAAYIVAYNTHAVPTRENREQDTRMLDLELKDYLFEKVFPLFGPDRRTAGKR
jgi:CubicO group peptidase (beta-lactamase class C family)